MSGRITAIHAVNRHNKDARPAEYQHFPWYSRLNRNVQSPAAPVEVSNENFRALQVSQIELGRGQSSASDYGQPGPGR